VEIVNMANNLFVSYDLYRPGQNYEAVAKAIKELGSWAKVQKSFWYVRGEFTSAQACQHVWQAMDANDSLIVVDATNNQANWRNISPEVATFIKEKWTARAA
jgi:hypothetical protein